MMPRTNPLLKKQEVLQRKSSGGRMELSKVLHAPAGWKSTPASQQNASIRSTLQPPAAETMTLEAGPRTCIETRCSSRGLLEPYHFLQVNGDYGTLSRRCIDCRLRKALSYHRGRLYADHKDHLHTLSDSITEHGKEFVDKYNTVLLAKRPKELLSPSGAIEAETTRLRETLAEAVEVVMKCDSMPHNREDRQPKDKGQELQRLAMERSVGSNPKRTISNIDRTPTKRHRRVSAPSMAPSQVTPSRPDRKNLVRILHRLSDLPQERYEKIFNDVGLPKVLEELQAKIPKAEEIIKLEYERGHLQGQKAEIERQLAEKLKQIEAKELES